MKNASPDPSNIALAALFLEPSHICITRLDCRTQCGRDSIQGSPLNRALRSAVEPLQRFDGRGRQYGLGSGNSGEALLLHQLLLPRDLLTLSWCVWDKGPADRWPRAMLC